MDEQQATRRPNLKVAHWQRARLPFLCVLLGLCLFALPFRAKLRRPLVAAVQTVRGRKTVADRVEQHGVRVRERLAPDFKRAGVRYPPARVILVGLKQERLLEVWVSGNDTDFARLKTYRILGASGVLGPKLREGDMQVPEGLYRIESLNPNSLYHLSLRLNYPNPFDRAHAEREGRTYPGSDIMIHGKTCSIGCLAMGDQAAEDLFILAADTGIERMTVVLSPVDFRCRELPADMPDVPAWIPDLYRRISQELNKLKAGPNGP